LALDLWTSPAPPLASRAHLLDSALDLWTPPALPSASRALEAHHELYAHTTLCLRPSPPVLAYQFPLRSPFGNGSQPPQLSLPDLRPRALCHTTPCFRASRASQPVPCLSEIRVATDGLRLKVLIFSTRPWTSGLRPPLLWPRVLIFSTWPWTSGLRPPSFGLMSFMPILPCVLARPRPSRASPVAVWQRIAAASAFTA